MRDSIGIFGLLLTVAGIAMVSRPGALIVAGIALVLYALFAFPADKKRVQ